MLTDSADLRARILTRLCDGCTQSQVRHEITADLGLTPGNAVITTIVRQLAEGRRDLLRPGAYRREAKRTRPKPTGVA